MKTIKEKEKNTFKDLSEKFGWTNEMQSPKIVKVVLSTGVGRINSDKAKMKMIPEKMAKIAGQRPVAIKAKKSIAQFKVREGQLSGFQVTLRGKRMNDFLDKLINVSLPRTRDFRGLGSKVDEMGNLTIGIKENTIFPETSDEDLKDVFGISVTVVTTAKNKEVARNFFEYLGFPFKK